MKNYKLFVSILLLLVIIPTSKTSAGYDDLVEKIEGSYDICYYGANVSNYTNKYLKVVDQETILKDQITVLDRFPTFWVDKNANHDFLLLSPKKQASKWFPTVGAYSSSGFNLGGANVYGDTIMGSDMYGNSYSVTVPSGSSSSGGSYSGSTSSNVNASKLSNNYRQVCEGASKVLLVNTSGSHSVSGVVSSNAWTIKPSNYASVRETNRSCIIKPLGDRYDVNCSGNVQEQNNTEFIDIANHKYALPIKFMKYKNYVQGYTDGTYKPDSKINRAAFSKIVVEAMFKDYDKSTKNCGFVDVVDGQWYNPYICELKERGVINGYPDGTFKPGQNVSFVEALKIISLAAGYDIPSGGEAWYSNYVDVAEGKNIIPLSIKTFSQAITRGEMADLISRLEVEKVNEMDIYMKDMGYSSNDKVTHKCLKNNTCSF